MPNKSIPTELEDVYWPIYERIKKENPSWSKEKVAKVTWSVIKKLYYKDKDGVWHRKERKVKADWVYDPKNFNAMVTLLLQQIDNGGDVLGENDKMLRIVAPAHLVGREIVDKYKVPDEDKWRRHLHESAGIVDGDETVNADYLYIESWLCHADVPNGNKLLFHKRDLEYAIRDGQLSPYKPVVLDINHGEVPIVGFVLGAIVDYDNEASQPAHGLRVLSVVLNWGSYAEVGNVLRSLYDEGKLEFSMSCIAEYCECSKCHALGKSRYDVCEHVLDMNDKDALLVAHHPVFYTNSIILGEHKPADGDARAVDIITINAKEKDEDKHIAKEQKMNEEQIKAMKDELEKLKAENLTLKEGETAKTIDGLNTELATLKDGIDELTLANEELNAKLIVAEQEKTALLAKVEEYNQKELARVEAERTAMLEARKTELAKYDLTDDQRKFFLDRSEKEDDNSWAMLLSTLKPVDAGEGGDDLPQTIKEKLEASAKLGGITNGPKTRDGVLGELSKATDKNLQ